MGRRLGQHFLASGHVVARIVKAAAPKPEEPVLEVGPGRGVLTEALLEAGARVTAIELDPELSRGLRERWGGHPRFRLIEGDVLAADLTPENLFKSGKPYAVVANLPYYLSTPFFFRIIAQRAACSRLVLMVQREIGERLAALPADGKAYGALSVAAHHAFLMRYLFTVPPEAFRPPPKVQSAVVEFVPRPPTLAPEEERAFLKFVRLAFGNRRKLLRNNLRRLWPDMPQGGESALDKVVGTRRAEDLTPAEHLEVFRLVAEGQHRPVRSQNEV